MAWKTESSGLKPEIWMINQYAITPDLPGGTRHYDFGCELVKAGYSVRIFASDVNLALRRHTKLHDGQLYREEDLNDVRFVWVRAGTYKANNWRRAWNMVSFAANAFRVGWRLRGARPRAIVGSSPHPLAALGAWILAKATRARFILELRDLWPQALIDMGGLSEHGLAVRGMRLLERFLYRVAEHIVILAPGSENYLIARGVPKDRIAYIPNGVHLRNFGAKHDMRNHSAVSASPGELAADAEDMVESAAFTVVYAGAHGPANSLETVLEAASLLASHPGIRFVLVGDGPSKASLLVRADKLHLENVIFLDPVPKEQMPDLLASADAALITLRAIDAFAYAISPNKLFDYMAAGKPVLCAVPGDMARLVQDTRAGIAIEPENPQALADAVVRLLETPAEERVAMGGRGRLLIQERYSREQLAKELLAIL